MNNKTTEWLIWFANMLAGVLVYAAITDLISYLPYWIGGHELLRENLVTHWEQHSFLVWLPLALSALGIAWVGRKAPATLSGGYGFLGGLLLCMSGEMATKSLLGKDTFIGILASRVDSFQPGFAIAAIVVWLALILPLSSSTKWRTNKKNGGIA